jgi:hypothetical protein
MNFVGCIGTIIIAYLVLAFTPIGTVIFRLGAGIFSLF